ncbi:MAG TPA: ribonuclease Z [Methanocella sp.]|nr:ribonuclease Z [Methanocella sp.]
MIKIIFLGTGGSIPTPNRGMPSFMIQREGERILFDCGEGTQRQMMKARSGFMDISTIFLTHFHADHTLGLPGLLQTMSFQGRAEALHIYGPEFVEDFCSLLNRIGYLSLGFPVFAHQLKHDEVARFKGYSVQAFRTFHSVTAIGYALKEDLKPGRFNKARALELGVPEGPLFSKLHRGETVTVNGREITSAEVVGEPRPGRTIVYTGDTVASETFLPYLQGADVWISESTYSDDMADKATETLHSTAGTVADLAARAGVKHLVLTHISSRYSTDTTQLLEDAKKRFENTIVAEDFVEIEVQTDNLSSPY